MKKSEKNAEKKENVKAKKERKAEKAKLKAEKATGGGTVADETLEDSAAEVVDQQHEMEDVDFSGFNDTDDKEDDVGDAVSVRIPMGKALSTF